MIYQTPIELHTNPKESKMFLAKSIFTGTMDKVRKYTFNKEELRWDVDQKAGKVFLTNNDEKYLLVEFHVHQKAEHVIDGKRYDLELHLVFLSDAGFLFVLGVLAKTAERTSKIFQKIIAGEPFSVPAPSSIPTSWSYPGSLTTPPFTQTVAWNVSGRILKITKQDLKTLLRLSQGVRKLQPRVGRDIVFAHFSGKSENKSDVCCKTVEK